MGSCRCVLVCACFDRSAIAAISPSSCSIGLTGRRLWKRWSSVATAGSRGCCRKHEELSSRALLIGLLGVIIVCAVVAGTELVYVKAGFLQLPPAALGGLLILVAGRHLFRQESRWRLQPHELAGIYGMLLV